MSAQLGQKVYVENKPGAGGMIALNDVLAQPRDGYNLSFCTYFDAINTLLYQNVSYKLADIAPITMVSKYYYLMALAKSVPVDTFDQFVGYAKAHPGEILYGTVGAGSTQELVAHELEKSAGIQMTKVPFKGANEITQEMLAGRVHFQVGPPIAVGPYYKSGQLKVLATTSPQRLKSFPEVPTLTELGLSADALRLARRLRRRRHAAADRRSAQSAHRLNHELGRIPAIHGEGRQYSGRHDARRIRPRHRRDR